MVNRSEDSGGEVHKVVTRDLCSDEIVTHLACSSAYTKLHGINCIELYTHVYQCQFPSFNIRF